MSLGQSSWTVEGNPVYAGEVWGREEEVGRSRWEKMSGTTQDPGGVVVRRVECQGSIDVKLRVATGLREMGEEGRRRRESVRWRLKKRVARSPNPPTAEGKFVIEV